MNKNKWFLNGGRGSGRTFRLLCETYENKIANLQHTVDTLQGYLDHDIEYDMDKTIQEQKIKIAELENKLTEKVTLESLDIVSAKINGLENNLTKAKDILKGIVDTPMYNQMGGEMYENKEYKELITKVEQFLKETQ